MNRLSKLSMLALLLAISSSFVINQERDNIRILLMGDSTTAGGRPIFEETMEQLLMADEGLNNVEVINVGLGGETAASLMSTGRYDREIKDIENIDYIFFRYGINDRIKRKPFDELFPDDMKKALNQVKKDFPEAQIILMTITPFFPDVDKINEVNEHIVRIAKEESIELFDICSLYQKKLEEIGQNSMNVRFVPLSTVPSNYHEVLKPFTNYVKWKDTDMVRLQTNEFDPVLGNVVEDWYRDQHPNNTGYRFLADESVKYLLPKLKAN